jgi:V/A-type H+-transporting ATPase subunit D
VSEATPTRSVVLEMKDERRAMHEGYVFLDEKCLLLAGEILRELARYDALRRHLVAKAGTAGDRLQAAIGRHGLQGLQAYPAPRRFDARLVRTPHTLMGVQLVDAELQGEAQPALAATDASSQAEAARRAFSELILAAAPLAAVAGNLARLSFEYQRSVRRARALQDVLLPELDRDVRDLETRLEELEQEDAIWMRQGRA